MDPAEILATLKKIKSQTCNISKLTTSSTSSGKSFMSSKQKENRGIHVNKIKREKLEENKEALKGNHKHNSVADSGFNFQGITADFSVGEHSNM